MYTSKLQRVIAILVVAFLIATVFQPFSADARGTVQAPAKLSLTAVAQPAARFAKTPTSLRNIPVVNVADDKSIREFPTFNLTRQVVDRSTISLDPALDSGASVGFKKYIEEPAPNLDLGLNGNNQGTNRVVNGYGVLPPDTNGDVSYTHYIQTVNNVFTIWDLTQSNPNTGLPLAVYGPARMSTLFSGLGGDCAVWDDGDPIVLYDQQADRWMMSQFALPNYPYAPFYQCIAVSATSDPLGDWNAYAFEFDVMNDYPHFGVWPDGYYMSINQFDPSKSPAWRGQGAVVFERDAMLAGAPARMIYIDTYDACITGAEWPCVLGGMLPSDFDGPVPPAGEPNYFSQFDDDAWGYSPDQLQIWSFTTDWSGAGMGTFTYETPLTVAAFDSEVCTNYARNCIRQPGTAQGVDAIADRLMYRLQYRNFGSYQTLVTNHTVDVNDVAGHAGIRWYELRKKTGAAWGVYQQGTFSPDSTNRWMGSAAMDRAGNIAIGYSVSDSTSVYPGIRYAGRYKNDPLGTMPQTEKTMVAGTGSQTHSAARWGDYSSMSVDPYDDCTMWFTSEWNRVTSSAEWYTYIGAFHFDCWGPEVTINQASGQADPAKDSPINFTVEFSEAVTGFDASDLIISGTAPFGTKSVVVTGSGATYNVAVSGMTGGGTVQAVVRANAVTDAHGNPSTVSTFTDRSVVYDPTAPTVTVNKTASQLDPSRGTTIYFTAAFSETVTGFDATDVSFAGSTAGGSLMATVTGSGKTYTIKVTGQNTPGNVVVSVPADAAADGAGNGNTASTSTDNSVAFDNVKPSVTMNQAAGQADPASSGPINFTVVFSEPVTGFTEADVITGGTALFGTKTVVITPVDAVTYNVAIGGMSSAGTVFAYVAGGSTADSAGNTNTNCTFTDRTVRYQP